MDSLTRVKLAGDQGIWMPGRGVVPIAVSRAQRVVEQYDERLLLGRHTMTGDWVVFIKQGPSQPPMPVIGLGRELPSPEEIQKRLYQADAQRHGNKILDDMRRHNDSLNDDVRVKADDASGVMAEGFDWGFRQMGVHPNPRIFVPS